MALQSARFILWTALLAQSSGASTAFEEEAVLSVDDACTDSSEACALNMLHLRVKPSAPLALAESAGKWCDKPAAAKLWPPSPDGGDVEIKVLTYNLFWWNLYGVRGGNGNSAGNLIKDNMKDQPFDVMGFQECDDGIRVLEPVGLMSQYAMIQGDHAVCVAYRKDAWEELGKGTDDVGEDMGSHYYGKRGAVWVRLKHKETGRTMLFVNHHGPLEVNSGGQCGGESVANNLAGLIHNRAQPGDILILVGDFNANSASLTVTEMWSRMVLLHSGNSFGGVDNIFGNMDTHSILSRKDLGSGGSDHTAISAVVKVGGSERRLTTGALPPSVAEESAKALTIEPPKNDWQHFWCGRLEDQVEYVVPEGGWSLVVEHNPQAGDAHDVAAPQRCCRLCQQHTECKSWIWVMWAGNGPLCKLQDALPTKKVANAQLVSGLSATAAAAEAAEKASKTAIRSLNQGSDSSAAEAPDAPVESSDAAGESSDAPAAPAQTFASPSCSANLGCAALSLSGDCCPNAAGTVLGCCNEAAIASSAAASDTASTVASNETSSDTADNSTVASTCHDATPGEPCYEEIMWAKTDGIFAHTDWYPGLTASSSSAAFQKVVNTNAPNKCPPPCA